jgi:CIC family chloride channel protein
MDPVNEFMDVFILGWILLVAVLSGVLGWGYNNLYAVISTRIKRDTTHNILIKVLVGSIIASWIGWLINPNILGTSRRIVYSLFSIDKSYLIGNLDFGIPFAVLLLILLSVKAFCNCVTVGSGMSAGFTGPTVIVGMLLGASIATIIGVSNGHANYYACIAAGFAGMLAGSMNVPLAAAIITIECFGLQYSFPAGIAAVVGFQINRFNTIYDYALKSESR